jgi:hypothetical protein
MIGIELLELVDIVSETASDVHHERCIGGGVSAGKQGLFHRVKRRMPPGQPSLSIATH